MTEFEEYQQTGIRNPCNDVVLPKVEKKEIMILKPEHMKDYLAEADRRGVLPIFFLELCSGLRKGELVALLWSDLDVERRTISVSKQAVRVKGAASRSRRPRRRPRSAWNPFRRRRSNCSSRSMKSTPTTRICSPRR